MHVDDREALSERPWFAVNQWSEGGEGGAASVPHSPHNRENHWQLQAIDHK